MLECEFSVSIFFTPSLPSESELIKLAFSIIPLVLEFQVSFSGAWLPYRLEFPAFLFEFDAATSELEFWEFGFDSSPPVGFSIFWTFFVLSFPPLNRSVCGGGLVTGMHRLIILGIRIYHDLLFLSTFVTVSSAISLFTRRNSRSFGFQMSSCDNSSPPSVQLTTCQFAVPFGRKQSRRQ